MHTWIQGLSGTPPRVDDGGGGDSAHEHVVILLIQML